MASKCMEKYGKEWSSELTKATLNFLNVYPTGIVKHIGDKGYRRMFDNSCFMFFSSVIPQKELLNQVFLFHMGKEKQLTYDCSYETVQDMVDDGWAID